MSHGPGVDVVVVVRGYTAMTLRCLESLLLHGGAFLGRLIVVETPTSCRERFLEEIANLTEDHRVRLLRPSSPTCEVEAYNHGIEQRDGDVVVLQPDTRITPGFLEELSSVAHSACRTACTVPLIDLEEGGPMSGGESGDLAAFDASDLQEAVSGLPRSSPAPVPDGGCSLLRGDVIDAVGLLDPDFGSLEHALADWAMRAQSLGFGTRRVHHAFARRMRCDVDRANDLDSAVRSELLLASRHPQLQAQLDRSDATLERAIAGHAIRLRKSGKLRVAYDLRPLPREHVGTRTYAVSLVRALASDPEIELTLLVREPSQARGLEGRVVTPDDWKDDVAVIHRPMQIIDPRDLTLLYESSAHIVITYQDLIGYRIPLVFPSDVEHQSYRATSCLSMQGVQRVLAYSESAAREIVEEFGIPRDEVDVVPLGVDADWFSSRSPRDAGVLGRLSLPGRYFFSIATDFPHKNLPCLIQAYAAFRARWSGGAAPSLVLAGYSTGARNAFYQQLESEAESAGVRFLGSVSPDELRVLYQHSEALIFPSLYEGFGLPPLEAMAAGVPVIAMPISSVPEVGGDCALYPEGLSPLALALAMERLLRDEHLSADLRVRGLERVKRFSWEVTARETCRVYRSAVLQPSARSVAMRGRLRDAILSWSDSVVESSDSSATAGHHPVIAHEPQGIRHAWRALNGALHRRIQREVNRLAPRSSRRSA